MSNSKQFFCFALFIKSLIIILALNKMDKGTAVFYHNHIQTNIAKLDERRDKFMYHRIEFLKEYCQPIREKINLIKKQIEKYINMQNTQEQIIDQEPQIASLREELSNYNHTRQYFTQKLNQYEQKYLEYQEYNKDMKKQLILFKAGIKNHQEDLGFQLPYVTAKRIAQSTKQIEQRSIHCKSFVLPSLSLHQRHNSQESSLDGSKVSLPKRKIINIGQKIQKMKNYTQSSKNEDLKDSQIIVEDVQHENQEQAKLHRKKLQLLRQRMTAFNKLQALFHDCLQVKKNSVQKSVSQLQSKLISNRQQFLNACHAIGSKQSSITFQQFSKLSGDEILTLFISFVWLNKRIKSQFVAKRKQIMQFIGKLPKLSAN